MGEYSMQKSVVLILLAAVAQSAAAQTARPADVWYGAGHIALSAIGDGVAAEWQFDRADNGDIRLIKNERRDGAKISGTVLSVCEDQALIFKDIAPAPRRELNELNDPVLHLQLAL